MCGFDSHKWQMLLPSPSITRAYEQGINLQLLNNTLEYVLGSTSDCNCFNFIVLCLCFREAGFNTPTCLVIDISVNNEKSKCASM